MLKKFAEQTNEAEVIAEDLDAIEASESEVVAEEEVKVEETLDEAKSVKKEEEGEESDSEDEAEVAESKKVAKESDDMEDEEGDDEDEEAEDDMEESKKSVKKEEVELTVDVQEDVEALLSGSDAELSEEFKQKATVVFEAAVKSKVAEQLDQIKESVEAEYQAQLESVRAELAEKVDGYLNYVVEEWVKDNALAIERGLKGEIAEEFMAGLKNLFIENYIDVPEEKADMLDELATKVDTLEAKLNEEFEANVEMKKELDSFKAKETFSEACQGLTATQVEKFEGLAEGVEFETIDQYREKLETIKESYFPKVRATGAEKEDSVDAPAKLSEQLSDTMSIYAKTLSSMKK